MPSPFGGSLPAPGEPLGPYVVERELGRGGMGAVFVARDPALDRRVALKVVALGRAAGAEQVAARFEVEARAVARVRHPNVVAVHAAGHDAGRAWLAMELVEGEPLDARLRRGPLDPRDAARWLAQAARGVAHAHAQGVLHRDLKPANIMIDARGAARVLDFGVARDVSQAERLTRTGELLGTPAYMAPEQACGEKALDARVDVWGLGATLYHALVGRAPYDGPTTLNIVSAILTSSPRRPRAERPELDPALEAIVLRCLERKPADRPPTAEALADALEGWLAGERPGRARALLRGLALALLVAALAAGLVAVAYAVHLAGKVRAPVVRPPPPPVDEPTTTSPPPAAPPTTEPPSPPTSPVAPAAPEQEPEPEPTTPDPPSIGFATDPAEPPGPDVPVADPPAEVLGAPSTERADVDLDLSEEGRRATPVELELAEGWWATPRVDGVELRTSALGAPALRLPITAPAGPIEVWVDAEVWLLDPGTSLGVALVDGPARQCVGAQLVGQLDQNSPVRLLEAPTRVSARSVDGRWVPDFQVGPGAAPGAATRLADAQALRLRLDPRIAGERALARSRVGAGSTLGSLSDDLPRLTGAVWTLEVGLHLPQLPNVRDGTTGPYVVDVLLRRVRVWGRGVTPASASAPTPPAVALRRAAWGQLAGRDVRAELGALRACGVTEVADGAALLLALATAERHVPAGETSRDRALAEQAAGEELFRLAAADRRGSPPSPKVLATSVSPARRALLARQLGGPDYAAAVREGQLGQAERDDWPGRALTVLRAELDRRPADPPRTAEQLFGEGRVWAAAGDYEAALSLLSRVATRHPDAAVHAGLAAMRARRPGEARRLWSLPEARDTAYERGIIDRYLEGLPP